MDKDLKKAQKRIDESEAKAEGVDEAFQEASRALELAQETIREIMQTLTPLEDAKGRVREGFEENKSKLVNVQVPSTTLPCNLVQADHLG